MLIQSRQLKRLRNSGFTLIEALALLFIFAVITMTFYSVFTLGTAQIIEAKNRLGAIAVANEKMEIIRNLDYDAVGTKVLNTDGSYSYGIPAGDILEDESITVNTRTFFVHTFIQYVDDALDGKASGTTPIDVIPNDYKRVRVEVSWGDGSVARRVSLVTTVVPKGMEVSSGGGTLSINVIDNSGSGIAQASVHITNTSVSPHIDITTNTDNTGNLILPGAKASGESYKIEVSKNGYYSMTTYASYPTTSFKPIYIHASVVEAAFNQKTIVMDKSADISLTTKDVFGIDFPNIGFHIMGGVKIGDTVSLSGNPSVPVYTLDQDDTSGTDAKKTYAKQSSGLYTLTLTDTTQYQLLRLNAPDVTKNTFSLTDGNSKDITATIIDTKMPAALVVVDDTSSGASTPLINASVHLSNTILPYDVTVMTDQYGQAYFPASSPALVAGTYDYTVTLAGYSDKSGTIVVTNALKTENVTLTKL